MAAMCIFFFSGPRAPMLATGTNPHGSSVLPKVSFMPGFTVATQYWNIKYRLLRSARKRSKRNLTICNEYGHTGFQPRIVHYQKSFLSVSERVFNGRNAPCVGNRFEKCRRCVRLFFHRLFFFKNNVRRVDTTRRHHPRPSLPSSPFVGCPEFDVI